MAFNRDNRNSRPSFSSGRSGGDRGGFRPRFNDRGDRGNDRGPVEMHSAVCDNCGKQCEVPFRPTSGKPIYCSNCFENQRGGSESRRSEERQMFSATCADCGNSCQVPFRPSNEKPVFCSNCFGEKKQGRENNGGQSRDNDKFAEINTKLDNILKLLEKNKPVLKEKKPAKIAKVKETAPIAPVIEE